MKRYRFAVVVVFFVLVFTTSLGGSARFLDSRTGKLLARWGSNGYVNYED